MEEIVHFVHNVGGEWRSACSLNSTNKFKAHIGMCSDEPRAVNCPMCMQSGIFTDRMIAVRAGEAGRK